MANCDDEFAVASYKGIEFEILPSDHAGGRRIVTNQYPFSDRHYNEDLGDKPLTWSIKGLFVGEGWRDKLTEAKARWTKQGAGEFFEPTENKLFQATVIDWSFSLDSTKLNSVEFSLELIERGDEPYPDFQFGLYQQSQALQKYRDEVREWYKRISFGFVDLGPAVSAYRAARGVVRRFALQWLRIKSFVRTIGAIDKAEPSRDANVSLDRMEAVFAEAIEGDAPIGFYRAASEIRTAPPIQSETQGIMTALVALGYYAEKAQEGVTVGELQEFRTRALALKLAVNDTAVSSQIDNLIMSLGSSIDKLCEYQGAHHALVASFELFGDVSRAAEIVQLSRGVSGAELVPVVYRCDQ